MNIGELNRRIKILEFVEQRDEFGGIEGDWKVIATRWSRIEQHGGNEVSDNNQVIARVSTKIIIRYIFVIGAGIVGSLLTVAGSMILGMGAYRATENWDNWKCDSCGKTFKR